MPVLLAITITITLAAFEPTIKFLYREFKNIFKFDITLCLNHSSHYGTQ